jgi:hypothetical protein
MILEEDIQNIKIGNTNYIVYDINGKILRTGQCPYDMVALQAGNEGEFVAEGVADDSLHQIDIENKVIIEKPKKTKKEIDEESLITKEVEDKRKNELLITTKINEILRNMAIEELKKEGKLKEDFI